MANARKILIVDDDTDLRDTLVEQLSLHDEFEASAVDTGAKGASAAKANAPDLVLMDVGLPDTDGREVVRSLRKGSSWIDWWNWDLANLWPDRYPTDWWVLQELAGKQDGGTRNTSALVN